MEKDEWRKILKRQGCFNFRIYKAAGQQNPITNA
jgi:hypothetical protein